MALWQTVFVQLLLTFTLGTLTVQLNHALEGSLRGNMKRYFHKKYFHMAGNSEKFEASNMRKWIGENVSKRRAIQDILHHALQNLQISGLFNQPIKPYVNFTLSKQLEAIPPEARERAVKLLMKMFSSLTSPAAGQQSITRENILENVEWFDQVWGLRMRINTDIESYPKSWIDVLNFFPDRCDETVSSHDIALPLLGSFPGFMNLFWPFRFDINVMNQRLALYGLTKKLVTNSNETLKEDFFKKLQDLQGLPVSGNKILFSFEDDDVIDGLNRSKILSVSKSYVEAGKHLFTKEEQQNISSTAIKALDMIKEIHPELYSSMVQLVSCIAFYKDEGAQYMGSASLGAIWLDPRHSKEWTVPFMAEQIVHEFIHTSLQYAELVLGGYKNNTRLPEAKAMSSIRHEPRDYDKSLHAAYVSAGLITFHTRAGFFDRAADLAQTLPEAVQELNRVNAETDVLDEAGRAMLNFLTGYVCLTRM